MLDLEASANLIKEVLRTGVITDEQKKIRSHHFEYMPHALIYTEMRVLDCAGTPITKDNIKDRVSKVIWDKYERVLGRIEL